MHFCKKVFLVLFALLLAAACATAEYYVSVPAGNPVTSKISVQLPGENPYIEGTNPITGERWSGVYHPILVTTDNHPDALPHWGVSSADLIYEFPIQMDGSTRLLVMYMGEIPNYAGPVRSGRVIQAKLREIWNSAWVFYGWQNSFVQNQVNLEVDVDDFVLALHADARQKGRWVFPFVEGTEMNYAKYFHREHDGDHKNPHDVQIDLHSVERLYTYEPTMHPFKFGTGLTEGYSVSEITVNYKTTDPTYITGYVYDPRTGLYTRYANNEIYLDALNMSPVEFANIIIVRTNITNQGNNASRVVIQTFGQGSADIFQNGYYIRGSWVQSDNNNTANEMNSIPYRMIFFDQSGNELEMKPGKTAILFVNVDQQVIVRTSSNIPTAVVQGTPAPTATPKPTKVPKATRTPKPVSGATPVPETAPTEEEDELLFGGN